MYRLLSYPLGKHTPVFYTNPENSIEVHTSIEAGDKNNHFFIRVLNHSGTHIDCPNHFHRQGAKIADFPIETFLFTRPLILPLEKKPEELITPSDIEPFTEQIRERDALLVKTGFGTYRFTDPAFYGNKNPGFAGETAEYLRESFPSLRAVGMDFPSALSPAHIEDGLLFHTNALEPRGPDKTFLFLIEDMNLTDCTESPVSLWVVPLFVEGIDSSPCTIIAEYP
jgi:kynurenine formamidase